MTTSADLAEPVTGREDRDGLAGDDRRRLLEQASAEWRAGLIDVSGSNRLLYFKPTASTVRLDEADPHALDDLLGGATVRLARLFPDTVARAVAQRACKALAAKQREAAEEYGVSVAHLAVGLATWSRGDESSPASTTPPAAPVLMRPLELRSRAGAVDSFELTLGGDTQLNPVLDHVLSGMGAVLDEETLLAGDGESLDRLEPVLERLRAACAPVVPGFSVTPGRVLGAFSYLKQPMVADCEDLDALLASDLVCALAGDPDAVASVRTRRGEVHESDPDYVPVQAEHLVLDADASQSYVVNAALAGRNLVVQGPPGTGKSQTIANVIACLVAEGRRVLFVAQKRAAVTAVLDRLDGVGLADLTLDLFAAGSSRRHVCEQLRQVLDRQSHVGAPVTASLHRALSTSRDRLVAHRDALHQRRHAWGVTVAEALAETYSLSPQGETAVRLPVRTLDAWGPGTLDELADALDELAAGGGLAPDRLTRPGWSATALTEAELVAEANAALGAVRGELLPAAQDALDALARELGLPAPEHPQEAADLLAELAEAADVADTCPAALDADLSAGELERLLAATDRAYRRERGVDVGWRERRRLARRAATLVPGAGRRELHLALLRVERVQRGWAARGLTGRPSRPVALAAARTSYDELQAGLTALLPHVQHLDLPRLALGELEQVLVRLAADRSRARQPRLHDLERRLVDGGCGRLLAQVRSLVEQGERPSGGDGEWAGDLLRHAAWHSVLDHALTTDPALAGVTGEDLDVAAADFAVADADHLRANAARVRRAAASRLTAVLDAEPQQHLDLKREVTKRRNVTAVRRLFEQAPDVMTAVKPVWAMSPLQVSRLLPATHCFDVVIFDEASQVKPADAVPALLRAPQAVVAGDSRQLPPTEFFTKVLDAEVPVDVEPVGGAGPELEVAPAAATEDEDVPLCPVRGAAQPVRPTRRLGESFTQDAESILFAVDRVLAGQSRRLLWHYRSRDERLIAVSNAHVYSGSLTTFPSADGTDCLRHEVAPPSPGLRGGTNSPEAEVRRVVDLVLEHARTRPEETLGVITFGVAHARRVEAALESALAEAPGLAAVLDADDREPFFVKNIERVQGDERDAVILSVGYGRAEDGRMRFFWGPLLVEGGERRLNVAISRARRRMTLVTSFAADDVPADAHPSEGFRLMHRFLRFMASGGTDLTGGEAVPHPLNPFEIDVRDRLTAAGLDLVPQLGVGSYRLDFAVRHPDHPGRFVLAVEADGANYHSGHTARERDRLRQRLLEGRGWRFHRIWSTDWFEDPDREVAATVAAYDAALAADARAHAQPSDPVAPETPSWHIAEARRTVPRPGLVPGLPIDRYDHLTLVGLVEHIRSDGVLRTRDEELTLLMAELGFTKRGRRIVAALAAAQSAVPPVPQSVPQPAR